MAPAGSVPSLERISKSVIRMKNEPTMNAVMYRVLGLGAGEDLPQPHLGDTEVEVCGTRVRGFAMPVKVGARDDWQTIRPTTEWQTLTTALSKTRFEVATDLYYIDVEKQ